LPFLPALSLSLSDSLRLSTVSPSSLFLTPVLCTEDFGMLQFVNAIGEIPSTEAYSVYFRTSALPPHSIFPKDISLSHSIIKDNSFLLVSISNYGLGSTHIWRHTTMQFFYPVLPNRNLSFSSESSDSSLYDIVFVPNLAPRHISPL